jgi:hypothetical protein
MLEETKVREKADSHMGTQHTLAPDTKTHRSPVFRLVMWVVILAAFAMVFFFVMTHRAAPQRAGGGPGGPGGGGGRRPGINGPPVTLNTTTVHTGNL